VISAMLTALYGIVKLRNVFKQVFRAWFVIGWIHM